MEELELWNLLVELEEGKIKTYQAHDEILRLFDVVGQSEQFYCFDEKNKRIDRCANQCDTCKRLKLMQ